MRHWRSQAAAVHRLHVAPAEGRGLGLVHSGPGVAVRMAARIWSLFKAGSCLNSGALFTKVLHAP